MAKILRKIPKREYAKYAKIGQDAEEVLSDIRDIRELMVEIKDNKELPDEIKLEFIGYLQQLSLMSCTTVSYYDANGLNTFQNAEKTGLTLTMTDEQIKILKNISRNTEFARVLFATGRYSGYVMLVLALGTMYIQFHNKFLYSIIKPTETYLFIGVAIFTLYCLLKNGSLAKNISNKIARLSNMNTL